MSNNSHGHITIVDKRPPQRPVMTVGHIYNIVQDPEPETRFPRINLEPEDVEDEVETKVVKPRRGRRPTVTASEVAETA